MNTHPGLQRLSPNTSLLYLYFVDVGEWDHDGDEDEGSGVRDLSRDQPILSESDIHFRRLKQEKNISCIYIGDNCSDFVGTNAS